MIQLGDDEYLSETVVGKIEKGIAAHDPHVVLVSCGFDAGLGDGEGFALTPFGYGEVIRRICVASGRRPVVVAMEGGYDPKIIFDSVQSVTRALFDSI